MAAKIVLGVVIALVLVGVVGGVYLAAVLGLVNVPFLAGPPPDPGDLAVDEDALQALLDRINATLDRAGPFSLDLSEEELNLLMRWQLSQQERIRRADVTLQAGALSFDGQLRGRIPVPFGGRLAPRLEQGRIGLEILALRLAAFTVPGAATGLLGGVVDQLVDLNALLAQDGEIRIDEVDVRPGRVRISGVSSREGGAVVVAEATLLPEPEREEEAFQVPPTPTVAPARQRPLAAGAWGYLALGDSLAAGTGASTDSARYADRFHAYLEARWGVSVAYDNHARPGENAPSFLQGGQVDLALASIAALRDDGDPATQVKVVTFQVGANDIFGFFLGDTCRSDPQGAACEALVDGALAEFGSNYRSAVQRLAEALDEGALLVLLDYYNPFNLGTGIPLEVVSEEKIGALNAQIDAVANELGLPVVPVHDAFGDAGGALTHILEGDEHPNDDGFAVMFSALVDRYVGAGGP